MEQGTCLTAEKVKATCGDGLCAGGSDRNLEVQTGFLAEGLFGGGWEA
jgi:hypothetical protein